MSKTGPQLRRPTTSVRLCMLPGGSKMLACVARSSNHRRLGIGSRYVARVSNLYGYPADAAAASGDRA